MPRVPGPVTQGAQQIGGVRPVAGETPFQNLRAPDNNAGEGLMAAGRGLQMAGRGAIEMGVLEEKRQLLAFEAEAEKLRQRYIDDPNEGLLSMKGEKALEAIKGSVSPDGTRNDGIATRYQRDLDALVAQFEPKVGRLGADSLTASRAALANGFTSKVNQYQIAQQNEVDKQITTTRIATAAQGAVAVAGTGFQDQALTAALAKIKSTVEDPDIGLGKQYGVKSPETMAQLVKEQQAIAVKGVIEALISQGQVGEANALLSIAMGKTGDVPPGRAALNGVLSGTNVGTELQQRMLAVTDAQAAQDGFDAIRRQHPGNISAQYEAILKEPDARRRKGLTEQWSASLSAKSAIEADQLGVQTSKLFQDFQASGGDTTKLNWNNYPAVLRYAPQLLMGFMSGSRTLSELSTRAGTAELDAHVRSGGSPIGSETLALFYKDIGARAPDQLVQMMEANGGAAIKATLNQTQWQAVQAEYRKIKDERAQVESGKAVEGIPQTIERLGVSKSKQAQTFNALVTDPEVVADIRNIRIAYHAKHGKLDAGADLEVQRALATRLLRVRREGIGYFDVESRKYSIYTLSDFERDGVDVSTLALQASPTNYTLLATHFGASVPDVKKAFESAEGDLTLGKLRIALGPAATARPVDQTVRDRETITKLATTAGWPVEFVDFAYQRNSEQLTARGKASPPMTVQSYQQFLDALKKSPQAQQQLFNEWKASIGG